MTALERIQRLLADCATPDTHLPPTILFNEGWMLRLVLDWCAQHPDDLEPFVFLPGARWYSEALLPSRFGGRGAHREGFTHADGVIGHFSFRRGGRGDIELSAAARQLSVVEAKMGSLLSTGTTNAKSFNQAARNVACMAHLAALHGATESLERLSFTVIAPDRRISERAFEAHIGLESLMETVRLRASMFDGLHDGWFDEQFAAILPRIRIAAVSWEEVVSSIGMVDHDAGKEFAAFLALCLRNNPMSSPRHH